MAKTPFTSRTTPSDPGQQIIDLASKLDRFIFANRVDGQVVNVGLVVAAIGTLLSTKAKSEEEMEKLVASTMSAIRAAYYTRTNQ